VGEEIDAREPPCTAQAAWASLHLRAALTPKNTFVVTIAPDASMPGVLPGGGLLDAGALGAVLSAGWSGFTTYALGAFVVGFGADAPATLGGGADLGATVGFSSVSKSKLKECNARRRCERVMGVVCDRRKGRSLMGLVVMTRSQLLSLVKWRVCDELATRLTVRIGEEEEDGCSMVRFAANSAL